MRNRDRVSFEELMTAQFSRLAEQAGKYIAQMSPRDRETILQNALDTAWSNYDSFNPTRTSLLVFWDDCLQEAVLLREFWVVRSFDRWALRRSNSLVAAGKLKVPEDENAEG